MKLVAYSIYIIMCRYTDIVECKSMKIFMLVDAITRKTVGSNNDKLAIHKEACYHIDNSLSQHNCSGWNTCSHYHAPTMLVYIDLLFDRQLSPNHCLVLSCLLSLFMLIHDLYM